MVLGDDVSTLETFVWILNHVSRSIIWFLFALKAWNLVKWLILTWSFIWWGQFIDWLQFETRPSSPLNFGMAYSREIRLGWLHMRHKAVNQEVNFYFRWKSKTAISPPISGLFEFFFPKLEIILRPLLWPKNPNLMKIADQKVYCNLKLTNLGNKSIVSSQIGYSLLNLSEKAALTWHFISISVWIRKNIATEIGLSLIILIQFCSRASFPQGLS